MNQTNITPIRVDICAKSEPGLNTLAKEVALVTYNDERDALIAADKIRRGPFGQKWDITFKNSDTIRQR